MAKRDRKCVFIKFKLHGQLAAILNLRSAGGEKGLSLQGMVDEIIAEWLQEHPVKEFLIEGEREGE